MLDNVKNILSQPEIQMLFSEKPDVYVKKKVQIRTQRPQITPMHISLFLSFFQTENLLHSVINQTQMHKQRFKIGSSLTS